MRQRINLYWPEFKPEFRWLNVGTMLVVWLLTLLIVVLVTMRLSATVQKQSAVLNQAQERTIQLDEELAMAKSQLAERKPSQVLSEEHETLNLSVSQKNITYRRIEWARNSRAGAILPSLKWFCRCCRRFSMVNAICSAQ